MGDVHTKGPSLHRPRPGRETRPPPRWPRRAARCAVWRGRRGGGRMDWVMCVRRSTRGCRHPGKPVTLAGEHAADS
eukprot:7378014-Prymnesium_polylepis.2